MESICVMGSPKTSNETFLPNGTNGIKDTAKITIGIIGSGDFAKSLTIRLIRCGYHVVIGSRNPKFAAEFLPHVVDVTHHEDAVAKASLIFVAIHREHYAALWDLKHLLAGKILVDVSNNMRVNQYPESNAEYLATLFPDSIVVKGFNVISAWALQLGPKDASRQVYICSNSIQARQQVMELARQLNFIPLDLGSLSSAREIENVPLRLFTLWKGPVIVAVSLATFFFIYSFIRDAIHPYVKNQQSDFYKIPIEIVNKTLPVVAITLLALVYFSGLLAAAYQLYYGTKYKRFPPWLENWLQCRKQLGLLSFFFTSVHVVYSLCLPMRRSERYLFLNMAYQQVRANIENSWNEEEVWRIEMYVSFGIMSFGLLSLLAVTSIPSVNKSLNWREFSFIQGDNLKSVDLNHVIKLFEETESSNSEEQLQALKKVIKHYEHGIPLKDLTQMSHILNQCAEKCQLISAFIEPTCEILKLFGLPFFKKKLSDEVNYAKEVQESIAQLGYLMRVPCSQVRIQVCKCIISFYHAEPSKKEFEVYQSISANYKKEMVELGDLAETLVLALTLVENQLAEKLWIIKTLQHLSSSEANCKVMMKAQAPIRLCSHMNDADPSGQLLFRSSEVLWNLLEKCSKEEIINQLSNLECVYALKEAFVNLLLHGSRHYDHQLRNDVLVVATLVAQNSGAPMIETGFAKQLILFATFVEVKSHNPLVKGLKLTYCYEDFELKKLLFNMLTVLAKDLCSVQLLHEGKVILALYHYVKPNVKPGVLDWSAAQYEELQLHAIATLATVAPLLIEDYISCNGNTRLLMFLEWCAGNDPFFGQGNSFHGTGGRGSKLAQMHYSLRVLNSVVSLCDDTVNLDLCDQGAIHQLLGILKNTANNYKENDGTIVIEIQTDIFLILSTLCENNLHRREIFGWEGVDTLIPFMKIDAKKFYSGLGHNRLLFSALNCVWCCIIGCPILEDYFLEKEGLFTLLDLLLLNQKHLCNLILGILVELCDNPKTVSHVNTWRGKKDQTAANLLINLWRQEEEAMGVKHDKFGRIVDTKKPLVGQFQKKQEVIPMPATCPTIAVMEVAENMRAKIYCLICKLGFENLPGLSAKDYVTLAIIRRYLDFKVGEIWAEVSAEIKKEKFRPVTPDQEALKVINETFENIGKMVVALQNEMLECQKNLELREEEKGYTRIQALHKQKEMVDKSWRDFLARTSNYEALKKAKRLQEKCISDSRIKARQQKDICHPTEIKGLNTTIASGRLVTVESTPAELTGGPLADTELALKRLPIRGGALKRIKGVQLVDSFSKDSVSVK